MQEIATASINSFGIAPKVGFESPSEQAITVSLADLRQIITEAVQDAIEPLQDEVAQLREESDRDREELAAMSRKLASLESLQESEISRVCCDIAYDRQRLARLEQRPLTGTASPTAPPRGEKSIARIAKIDEVLKSRGPTTLSQMGHILKISPKEMNRLLAKLDMRRYELHARPGDDREKVLRFKAQIR